MAYNNYWLRPDRKNLPIEYLKGEEKSDYLGDVIPGTFSNVASILEIGCNVGRNLFHLNALGFHVEGIEINPAAVALGETLFEGITYHEGDACVVLPKLGQFDLIFTMAALQHIPPTGDHLFAYMAEHTSKILTIEDERHTSGRHYARNYKDVFERLGFEQIFSHRPNAPFYHRWLNAERKVKGFGRNFVSRAFEKPVKESR